MNIVSNNWLEEKNKTWQIGSVFTNAAIIEAVANNENGKVICKFMPLEPIKVVNIKEVSINGKVVELK